MAKSSGFLFYYTFFVLINTGFFCIASDEDKKTYIVYMGSLPERKYSPVSHHLSILQGVMKETSLSENSLVRSYTRSFNGFAAKLTDHERQTIANMEGVVSVFPSLIYWPETTRSWDFMGFPENIGRNPSVESDIIVGVIDSGIRPESDSFKGVGFGPAPKKWKGVCRGGPNFACNNKIIGARFYGMIDKEHMNARDDEGHGTHTASTAAGNIVKSASYFRIAEGVARGAVPSSRIAVYKVCEPHSGCDSASILAAFDDAIADGVDIITISLGFGSPSDFDEDSIAIGAFHAMKRGILTVNSAGNSGPVPSLVSSLAPWVLSVAASTIDRRIIDKVVLGNGKTLIGDTVNSFTLNGVATPLIHGEAVSTSCPEELARLCTTDCIDKNLAKGKIVLCDKFDFNYEAFVAGAIGSIMNAPEASNSFSVTPFSSSSLSAADYAVVLSYVNSTRNPVANILKSEAVKDSFAPKIAWFSSRGPNPKVTDMLKPDISAPGVEILAAYSPVGSPSEIPNDKRSVKYNILSGTSMACPHAAGAAAYVKSFHPDWSPSAIKSSIMTTALTMNHSSDNEFAYGSGHINPAKATNPGLVYEIFEKDYINMLCGIFYSRTRLVLISGDNTTACDKQLSPKDLNYPSMSARVPSKGPTVVKFTRREKNVGLPNSIYKANVFENFNRDRISVSVTPSVISFTGLNEEKVFEVSVTRNGLVDGLVYSASLIWSDGIHNVRSPIVIYTP